MPNPSVLVRNAIFGQNIAAALGVCVRIQKLLTWQDFLYFNTKKVAFCASTPKNQHQIPVDLRPTAGEQP
jgi:hypothetical protein